MNTILMSEMEQVYSMLADYITDMAGQTILITGATGLIGAWMVDFLVWLNVCHNMNIRIFAAGTSQQKLKQRFGNKANLHYVECDLSVPNAIQISCQFDRIIHAASPTDPIIYATNPVGVIKTNIIGTMQILDVAVRSNAQVVFLSSGEVYGTNNGCPFKEFDCANVNLQTARACYPAAKVACEALCQSYAKMYGTRINIVRPCFVYGPVVHDNTSTRVNVQFLQWAIAGKDIVLNSAGNQNRSWCYVADVVSAILYVMLRAPQGVVYNIANKSSVATIYQYAQVLAHVAGVKVQFALGAKQKVGNGLDCVLDAARIIELGWRPCYDLRTGLVHCMQMKSLPCVGDE